MSKLKRHICFEIGLVSRFVSCERRLEVRLSELVGSVKKKKPYITYMHAHTGYYLVCTVVCIHVRKASNTLASLSYFPNPFPPRKY